MIEYELTRSRRKTVCLKIESDGRVRVLAPQRMPKRDIDAFVMKNAGFIETHLKRVKAHEERFPPLNEEEKARMVDEAIEYIPGRVEYYGRLMGLEPAGIRVTMAEHRFGSCSGKNRLCFSYRLMRYPREAIDYVVVHELSHIVHKNHGRDFYRLIESVLPDWQRRENMLRE